jgi:hypothetical protein
MQEDIAAIKDWASIFKDTTTLVAKVTSHIALHRKAFKADVAALKSDGAAGLWFTTGKDLGDLLTLAIGPIKPKYPDPTPEVYGAANSIMAVPDFVAGLIYGWTGDNNLPEIE